MPRVLTVYQDLGDGKSRAAQFPLGWGDPTPEFSVDGDRCLLLTRTEVYALHTLLEQVTGGHTEESLAGYHGNNYSQGVRVSEMRRAVEWRDKLLRRLK